MDRVNSAKRIRTQLVVRIELTLPKWAGRYGQKNSRLFRSKNRPTDTTTAKEYIMSRYSLTDIIIDSHNPLSTHYRNYYCYARTQTHTHTHTKRETQTDRHTYTEGVVQKSCWTYVSAHHDSSIVQMSVTYLRVCG